MKKNFIFYTDMDGIMNGFESDKNARINMYTPGYFINIPTREGMNEVLIRINRVAHVVVLSKIIDRLGVTKEKTIFLANNYSPDAYDDIIFVPYDRSKADYLFPNIPSMILDDKESNLDECTLKGSHGLFMSDIKISTRYPNAKTPEDVYKFFEKVITLY